MGAGMAEGVARVLGAAVRAVQRLVQRGRVKSAAPFTIVCWFGDGMVDELVSIYEAEPRYTLLADGAVAGKGDTWHHGCGVWR